MFNEGNGCIIDCRHIRTAHPVAAALTKSGDPASPQPFDAKVSVNPVAHTHFLVVSGSRRHSTESLLLPAFAEILHIVSLRACERSVRTPRLLSQVCTNAAPNFADRRFENANGSSVSASSGE